MTTAGQSASSDVAFARMAQPQSRSVRRYIDNDEEDDGGDDGAATTLTLKPREPKGLPPSKADYRRRAQEVLDKVEGQTGLFSDEFCDCIAVSIADPGFEAAVTWDDKAIAAIEAVPGMYWKIGCDIIGATIFRQAPLSDEFAADAPNCKELYYSLRAGLHGTGWYITDTLQPNSETFAYCPNMSGEMHMPYWQKHPNEYAQALDAHMFYEHKFVRVAREADGLMIENQQREDRKEAWAAQKAAGHGNPGGGWFNKTAALLKEYNQGNWGAMQKLVDTYSAEPNMANKLASGSQGSRVGMKRKLRCIG